MVDLIDGNGFILKHIGDVKEIEETSEEFITLPAQAKKEMSHKSEYIVKTRASLNNMVNQHVKAIEYVIGQKCNI